MEITLKYFCCPNHKSEGFVGWNTDKLSDCEECEICGSSFVKTSFKFNGIDDIIGMPEEVTAPKILQLAENWLENANYHSEINLVDKIYKAFGNGKNDCVAAIKIAEIFRNYPY